MEPLSASTPDLLASPKAATAADPFRTEYKGYNVVIPTQFSELANNLVEAQLHAIDIGAVYKVKDHTRVDVLAQVTGYACAFMNIGSTERIGLSNLPALLGVPVALLTKESLVVAGVFLLSVLRCMAVQVDKKLFDLSRDSSLYETILEEYYYPLLGLREKTDLSTAIVGTELSKFSHLRLLHCQALRFVVTVVLKITTNSQNIRQHLPLMM